MHKTKQHNRQGLGWLLWVWCAMATFAACEAGSSGHRVISDPLSPIDEPIPQQPATLCPPCDCSPQIAAITPQNASSTPEKLSLVAKPPQKAPKEPPKEASVDLNLATAEELMRLPGVGRVTAEKIIAYREKRRFRSTRDLMRVKGIGRSRWRKLKDRLTVTR